MARLLALALLTCCAIPVAAQQPSCSPPPDLDFWLGSWALSWSAPGDTTGQRLTGTNTIRRTYGGCVIEERFAADTGYEGMSLTVYDPSIAQWRQTWVDNGGGYLVFTGGPDAEGRMVLHTAPFANPQGQTQVNRMTWVDVTPEALTWRWQRTLDDGATWTTMWEIHYRRR